MDDLLGFYGNYPKYMGGNSFILFRSFFFLLTITQFFYIHSKVLRFFFAECTNVVQGQIKFKKKVGCLVDMANSQIER